MFKAVAMIALIFTSGAARADDLSPWFGSDAIAPEQFKISVLTETTMDSVTKADCAIYDCTTLVNIAKPEQKSASNP